MANSDDLKVPKLIDEVPTNSPKALENLCVAYIASNPCLLFEDIEDSPLRFRQEVYLPPVLSDAIFQYLLYESSIDPEKIMEVFCDQSHCCLQRCHLSNIKIKTNSLYELCSSQNVQILELFNVKFNNKRCDVEYLLKFCSSKLLSLQLHNVTPAPSKHHFLQFSNKNYPILKCIKFSGGEYAWHFEMDDQHPNSLITLELNHILPADETNLLPYLKKQNEKREIESRKEKLKSDNADDFDFNLIDGDSTSEDLLNETNLKILENTAIPTFHDDVNSWSRGLLLNRYSLDSLRDTLLSLTLFNTEVEEEDMSKIVNLNNLQHLDIGCCTTYASSREFKRPTTYSVWDLIDSLPNLVSLDVSNTEIGDRLYIDGKFKEITAERCLSRPVTRKLTFLGLSETDGCEVVDIYDLADEVSGYHNEHQIMTALQRYRNRPSMLKNSYNHLYAINRHQSISCPHKLLQLLIESIHSYPNSVELSPTCTANLFFLTRQHYHCYTTQQRRDIIMAVVKYLERQDDERLLVRNALMTLFHFEVPGDFLFRFGLITRTILKVLVLYQDHTDINHLAINMCNNLVCSMKHDMKAEVAKYDFVPTVMSVIRKRLNRHQGDEVMQTAWSTLWNVSDETPMNSETFLDHGGLYLLEECFATFDDMEIYRNMMGLVGNIAEVAHLRKYLMDTSLVPLFHKLLIQEDQHLEIAYNISGTLSHLISDGEQAWKCSNPTMDEVRKDMFRAIQSWDVTSPRSINYRSFHPILNLIKCDIAECIHWAVWALCNLSQIDGSHLSEKYCELISDEDGVEILKTVEERPVEDETKSLARVVVERVQRYVTSASSSS